MPGDRDPIYVAAGRVEGLEAALIKRDRFSTCATELTTEQGELRA